MQYLNNNDMFAQIEQSKRPKVCSNWRPKVAHSNLPWRLTKIFVAEDGEQVYRLEKYQGGRNSPALLTKKKLLQNFKQDE